MPKRIKPTQSDAAVGREYGASGTHIIGGVIDEEHNNQMKPPRSFQTFDKMRKADATIHAGLTAIKLPIIRANWFIEPGGDSKQDILIKDFVEHNLFEAMTITWADLIRHALLDLDYGVMPMEKVFETRTWEGREMTMLKKLSPRLPQTIEYWETEDGEDGIQQILPTGKHVSIPIEKLLIFVNDKEGENWWGISLLRRIFAHYDIKWGLYRIQNIGHERQHVGIPKIQEPEGGFASESDRTAAEKALENIRANEMAYLIEKHGSEFTMLDTGTTGTDIQPAINHHNREMLLAMLGQFLDLGSGETGSRALSEDQSDFFLNSADAKAAQIGETISKHAIKQLVDLNFNNVENYPIVRHSGITRRDVKKIAETFKLLSEGKAIKATDQDEEYLRGLLELPERDPEDETREDQDPPAKKKPPEKKEGEEDDDVEENLSRLFSQISKKKRSRDEVEALLEKATKHLNVEDRITALNAAYQASQTADETTGRHIRQAVTKLNYQRNKRIIFQRENEFKSWRELTPAEKKVNFSRIEETMNKLEANLSREVKQQLNEESERYMKRLTKAVVDNDTSEIKKAELRFKTKYSATLKEGMRDAYDFGKNNAAREIGVNPPPRRKEILGQIDVTATNTAERHAQELTSISKQRVVDAQAQGLTKQAAIASAARVMQKRIERLAPLTADIIAGGYINQGRNDTFERNEDDIYAYQRSEILDRNTCNYCLSIDGRIVDKDDDFRHTTVFHHRCRGIWVAILEEEEDKPEIEGVPESLRERFGDAPNELIQPSRPFNKENRPASDEIKRRNRQENIDEE